jgi:hypothetical protein
MIADEALTVCNIVYANAQHLPVANNEANHATKTN